MSPAAVTTATLGARLAAVRTVASLLPDSIGRPEAHRLLRPVSTHLDDFQFERHLDELIAASTALEHATTRLLDATTAAEQARHAADVEQHAQTVAEVTDRLARAGATS